MTWDPVWEKVYRSRPWGQYPGEDVIRFVKRRFAHAADPARVRLLEVGCGSGANLWFMAREGFSAHGIDGSETAVRLAQERLDRECPGWRDAGGEVRTGDFSRLDHPDAHFDAVLDVVAVCYSSFEDAAAIYRELARVTKPGGRIFVRTFSRGCWGEGTGQAAGPGMWHCDEGPLAALGATRFTAVEDVPRLLSGWQVENVEVATATLDNRRHEIRHLVIEGVRP